ncbi:ParE toxin of type II toxin-antitoxin system, parDE [Geodermatophilus obscurus]|uniref:ParE toxin of type II toxin-antitoxin system, parDE n=1 Tax=Geodermatophilus obscurus TaxID=1861 RepID=A0A1M7U1W8_9ACTN|nr:ParE toxin of type II toxin-antitoxin system, parDE [Geodermatophilus obscurus]
MAADRRDCRGTYRVVYRIDEDTRTVTILDVAHRHDAYRTSG